MRRKVPDGNWRNRIVESGVKRADQFLAHPDNWRVHPGSQEEALVGILNRVGWVQDVIESKRTGHVLDGHLRVKAALRKGDATPVPYKVVDVTEHEEALLLASLDPLSALATTDQAKYDELVGLLPEEFALLASLAKGDVKVPTTVQFEVQEHHRVVVECESEEARDRLLARLTEDGYACRAGR